MIDKLKTSLAAAIAAAAPDSPVPAAEKQAAFTALRSQFHEAVERWNSQVREAREKAVSEIHRLALPFLHHDADKLHHLVNQMEQNLAHVEHRAAGILGEGNAASSLPPLVLIRDVENFLAKIQRHGPALNLTPSQMNLGPCCEPVEQPSASPAPSLPLSAASAPSCSNPS